MLTVSEKGYGKRTPLAEYRITSRGGKGVINLKSTDRNGPVVAALQVHEESDVMIITDYGKVIRVHANEIREAGRSTQGVRLLRLEEGDDVAAAAVLQEEKRRREEVAATAVSSQIAYCDSRRRRTSRRREFILGGGYPPPGCFLKSVYV